MTKVQRITSEEFLRMKQQEILFANEAYLKGIKIALKTIDKLKPKDRLDYAAGIYTFINAMSNSVDGWIKWNDVITLEGITEKQYKEIFPKMKEITKQWLEIDYYITKAKTNQFKQEFKKEVKKQKKTEEPTGMYT